MKQIKIFVSGAKKLKEERLGIKALANDISAKLLKQGVSISVYSYENFGEQQDSYNDFIANEADLIIFIIDGYIGKKTEDEYRLAFENFNAKGAPKILTFFHSYTEPTDDINYAEGIINTLSKDYYIEYQNKEELLALAKDRIVKFISGEKETANPRKCGKLYTICFSTILLILSTIFLISSLKNKHQLVINIDNSQIKSTPIELSQNDLVDYKNESNSKLKNIIEEFSHTEKTNNLKNDKTNEYIANVIDDIKIVSSSNKIENKIRRIFKKQDSKVTIKVENRDSCYIFDVDLNDWQGEHNNTTFEVNKNDFSTTDHFISHCKKILIALILKNYSPIATILFDYNILTGLDLYEGGANPWKEELFESEERELILSQITSSDSIYSHLILATSYAHTGLQQDDPALINKAIYEYGLFAKSNKQYSKHIQEKIKYLNSTYEEITTSPNTTTNYTLPQKLIESGRIPTNTLCEQIIIVNNQKSSIISNGKIYQATLRTFEKEDEKWLEKFEPLKANLGIKGIADVDTKKEGDLKTPAGFFPIPFVMGYDEKEISTKMKFIEINYNHIWICDPKSEKYNTLIEDKTGEYKNNPKNEKLKRHDHLNKYLIAIDYNKNPTTKGKGSAIFIHVERHPNHQTAGCISIPESNIISIIKWLDPAKKPHIYISKD